MSNIVLSLAAEIADIGSHVYRGDSQPRLASGHPAARVVSRGWQAQEAHPGQPVLLGPGGEPSQAVTLTLLAKFGLGDVRAGAALDKDRRTITRGWRGDLPAYRSLAELARLCPTARRRHDIRSPWSTSEALSNWRSWRCRSYGSRRWASCPPCHWPRQSTSCRRSRRPSDRSANSNRILPWSGQGLTAALHRRTPDAARLPYRTT